MHGSCRATPLQLYGVMFAGEAPHSACEACSGLGHDAQQLGLVHGTAEPRHSEATARLRNACPGFGALLQCMTSEAMTCNSTLEYGVYEVGYGV